MAALSTTKRKFTRLLDSISAPSAPPSPQPSGDRPVKKPRTVPKPRPQSAYVSSSPHLSALLASQSRTSLAGADSDVPHKLPEYTPWSRTQFLARLETYSKSVLDFSPKPDAINEVAWAKRGWTRVAPETVGCGACGKRVVVDVKERASTDEDVERTEEDIGNGEEYEEEMEWKRQAQTELIRRYEGLVINGHGEDCLWRIKGCDGKSSVRVCSDSFC